MKLVASAAINMQYTPVLPVLCHCLPVFDEICGMLINYPAKNVAGAGLGWISEKWPDFIFARQSRS